MSHHLRRQMHNWAMIKVSQRWKKLNLKTKMEMGTEKRKMFFQQTDLIITKCELSTTFLFLYALKNIRSMKQPKALFYHFIIFLYGHFVLKSRNDGLICKKICTNIKYTTNKQCEQSLFLYSGYYLFRNKNSYINPPRS